MTLEMTTAMIADFERDREAGGDLDGDGLARPHRGPEVAAKKPQTKSTNCRKTGLIEAELGVAGGDRAGVERAAAGAEPHDADVARDQAHQQKDQCRRSDQRRDHQQDPLHDVSIHRLSSFLPSYPPSGLVSVASFSAISYLSSHTVDKS